MVPPLGGFAGEMGGRVICLGGTTCIVYCLFVYFSCHVVELPSYLTSKIFLCLYETSLCPQKGLSIKILSLSYGHIVSL